MGVLHYSGCVTVTKNRYHRVDSSSHFRHVVATCTQHWTAGTATGKVESGPIASSGSLSDEATGSGVTLRLVIALSGNDGPSDTSVSPADADSVSDSSEGKGKSDASPK